MSEWIPLMDYAMKTGVSLSTLRRHIKANKVRYRIEGGKYLIQMNSERNLSLEFEHATSHQVHHQPSQQSQQGQQEVLNELKKAQEEIAELKTLIAFYEESMNSAHL